ncbi:helix-turn-helix domain-containing protein [Hymenobacter lapidiphilus]|uniref:Helix-turn-helix transcriptional regulator n=1 Tax=Hymenobacter lapidiphilus TaxID=2608003 RepID=A0A7Y7U5E0_9BACT|nr:helix-turn-helix domain-containing protein [Hymenobacter lapidiphilus]NVO31636.1 helix-turn-helix transcriptional regulator [Hymenobacter lapidiphilus]
MLILLPTLSVAQWMLGFAGWYDSHDSYSTFMFYMPWQLGLLMGPVYYLYFRSLTRPAFYQRPALRHLLPGLAQITLFAAVAAYDLGWWRGVRQRPLPDFFGTKGYGATLLGYLELPLALAGYALLLVYTLRVLADYRRYYRYLNDNFSNPERLRFAGLRQILLLQVASLGLGLLFTGLNEALSLNYQSAWYFYVVQGCLVYGLIVVGLQANYAAASSPLPLTSPAPLTLPPATSLKQPLAVTTASVSAVEEGAEQASAGLASLPSELLAHRDHLVHFMETEQPWLRAELTLAELAQALHVTPGILSRVINTGCGCNFSDFVNGYRVRAATERLASPRYAHYSLVGVAFDCGFNSKSTFNRVFKKLAGYPPSDVTRPNT